MAVKSSFKNMTLCLMVICLVCSALLAGVYSLTKEPIAIAKKAKNDAAIKFVLPADAEPFGEEQKINFAGKIYKYVVACDENGEFAGCAIDVAPVGFGGPIEIKVGFNAEGIIWNTKVLSQSETPGLGAKCVEPKFANQFKQFDPEKKNFKVTKNGGQDGGSINAITASTITSRAYANGLAEAAKVFPEVKKVFPEIKRKFEKSTSKEE